MTGQPSLIDEIEGAIAGNSSDRRSEMLRRVTDLFVATAPHLSDAQTGVFDDVFAQLIKEIEQKALRELSARVAPLDNAPQGLISKLACNDAIDVSGPVLEQSKRLDDEELVEIAKTKSQRHLVAIAGRAQLDEAVTDVLVERGDYEVARKVAANEGARFSEISMRSLVTRAGNDDDLAMAVARRRELPPALFRNLVARATREVRMRLLDTAPPTVAREINKILEDVSRDVEGEAAPKRSYEAAQRLVMQMHQNGGMTPMALLQFAKTRQVEETIAALSLMTGTAIDVVDRCWDESGDDGLLILGKSIELDWTTVGAILAMRLNRDGLHKAYADEVWAKYRKLTASAAQRVIRFWHAREKLTQPS